MGPKAVKGFLLGAGSMGTDWDETLEPDFYQYPFPFSHKDIVAEGLRQLLGEEKYRQDLTVPPGYCTGELRVGGSPRGGARLRPWLFSLQTSCYVSAAPVLCFL